MRIELRFGFAVLALAMSACNSSDRPTAGLDGQVLLDHVVPGADIPSRVEASVTDAAEDAPPVDTGPCRAGQTLCPDQTDCVSLRSDVRHCGSCTHSCELAHVVVSAARCDMGRCVIGGACAPGYADCNGLETDGCETSIADGMNCGACGNRCGGPTSMCQAMRADDGGVDAGPADAATDATTVDDGAATDGAATDGAVTDGAATDGATNDDGGASTARVYACVSGCAATELRCGTACVDVTSDATHCGGCGRPCAGAANALPACRAGVCALRCAENWADCNGVASDGCEVFLPTDRGNCGRCSNACGDVAGATGVCEAGRCGITCGATAANCDGNVTNGCETNLLTDPRNCGGCGTACMVRMNSTAVCRAGVCGITCPMGRADCDGNTANECEVDTSTDANHCGGCATACPTPANATATCAMGGCGLSCLTGFGDCDRSVTNGCEVDTRVDPMNCGGCGRPCVAPANGRATCAAGACGFVCDEGYTASASRCAQNPPLQISPRSTTFVTSRRPTFRWAPTTDFDGVRLFVCSDRECVTELARVDALRTTGSTPTTVTLTADLPVNTVVYWRIRGMSGGALVTGFSPAWEIKVRGGTGMANTAWGSFFDANGDGRADVALGSQAQAVLVYHGTMGGMSTTPTTTLRAPTGAAVFGFAVANAGDVNGDGYSDLAVGAQGSSQVFVYHGGPTGFAATPNTVIRGTPGRFLGSAVAGVGDTNHDGFADLAVGVPGSVDAPVGAVYIYRGSARGVVAGSTPAQVLVQPTGAQAFALDLAAAGDVNGDGAEDLLVGAGQNTAMTVGALNQAYLYFGGADALAITPGSSWSTGVGSGFGHPVAGAGDVNGDGYADIAIGAASAGYVNVYAGSAMGPGATETIRLQDGARDFGRSVATAGDLNRDGFDDLLVGTNYGDRAVAYYGSSSGIVTAAGALAPQVVTFRVSSSGGYTVASPGDINGDGFSDAILGARDLASAYYFPGGAMRLQTMPTITLVNSAITDLSISVVGM